jgi:hypothetical protein
MRYWITAHYPHPRPNNHPWHVYLKAEFDDIARMFARGDPCAFLRD